MLDSLEGVYISNVGLVRSLVTRCVDHEMRVMPIVSKCHQEMVRVVESIDGEADARHVVNR